jgi:hypothetical protein
VKLALYPLYKERKEVLEQHLQEPDSEEAKAVGKDIMVSSTAGSLRWCRYVLTREADAGPCKDRMHVPRGGYSVSMFWWLRLLCHVTQPDSAWLQ